MAFWDWVDKKIDKSFDRIEKRMDDTFNKMEKIIDPDYVDFRSDEQIEESKARDQARLNNILFSDKNTPFMKKDNRTKKEKREDKKDFQELASDTNETVGKIVKTTHNIEDTINNAMNGINPAKVVLNELSGEEEILEIGDHLYVQRIGYTHHGIFVGGNSVIHYLLDSIQLDSLEDFKESSTLRKMSENESPSRYPKEVIVSRAYSRYQEDSYNLLVNNCEHFCRWCRYGD